MILQDFWEIDDDGDGLPAFGMIDPVFDASEYQVAENIADVFLSTPDVVPDIIGNKPDISDKFSPCEITYKKKLQSISVTDMDNYRRVLKAQMRV